MVEEMRQKRNLHSKITKLERRVGMRGPMEIPPGVQTVYFFDQKEGQSDEEIEAKIKRQKAELAEKYGERIISKLHFIVFENVSSDREKPQQAL